MEEQRQSCGVARAGKQRRGLFLHTQWWPVLRTLQLLLHPTQAARGRGGRPCKAFMLLLLLKLKFQVNNTGLEKPAPLKSLMRFKTTEIKQETAVGVAGSYRRNVKYN